MRPPRQIVLVLTSAEDVTANLVIEVLNEHHVQVARVDPADIGTDLLFDASIGDEHTEWDGRLRTPSRDIGLAEVGTGQVRAGGSITTPMWGWMGGVAFAHLICEGEGTASGRFLKQDLYFMRARSHMPPPRPPIATGTGPARESRIDPAILDDEAALFVAQLAAPAAQRASGDGMTILLDVGTGSRADVRPDPGGGWIVHQHGPMRLWDAVEDAVLLWQRAGAPHQSAFGLTVAGDRQYVWLGEPDGPSWDLPA